MKNQIELNSVQLALIAAIKIDLRRQRWSLLKAGTGSGKSTVAETVIKDTLEQYDCLAVFAPTPDITDNFIKNHVNTVKQDRIIVNKVPNAKVYPDLRILAVLEEVFFIKNSYDLYIDLLADPRVDLLVLGSRGLEFDQDTRWKILPGRSFSTMELNYTVVKADFFEREVNTRGLDQAIYSYLGF